MPPAPKHPSVRARRNKTSTAATLSAGHNLTAPPLPADRIWHPQTLAWWADVWASPMAPEYDSSDIHGLFVLAVLVDGFWYKPHWTAAAEIRLQRQCFGLTPIDRRRLQWEIEKVDEAVSKGEQRRSRAEPAKAAPRKKAAPADPRQFLKAV